MQLAKEKVAKYSRESRGTTEMTDFPDEEPDSHENHRCESPV
jgi:hypothetical protein